MINPIGTTAQSFAQSFEYIICNAFKCEKGGAFGIADADFIRKYPLTAITATCCYVYAKYGNKGEIEKFLSKASFYFQFSLDVLLSFDTDTKCINNIEYTLDYNNGAEALYALEEEFGGICEQL